MVTAVDDEQEVQPKGAASPTSKQEAELDIELTEKNKDTSGWKEVGEITLPGTVAVQPQTPPAKPSRRPRSPRHNRVPSAPRIPVNPTNDSASPAIAPTGLHPNLAPVQPGSSRLSTEQEDSNNPTDEIAQSSPITSALDEPTKSSETDKQSAASVLDSQSNYAPESVIAESDASPAYVSQDELVPDSAQNQSSIGQPEEPVAGNTDEEDSATPPQPTATGADEQKKNDGGGLDGVENTFDPYAASEPKNQGAATSGAAAAAGALGGAVVGGPAGAAAGAEAGAAVGGEAAAAGAATGAAETSSTVATGQESAIARANRAETVGQQKSDQQTKRAEQLALEKVGSISQQVQTEARDKIEKAYKQAWQLFQEGAEDAALSFTDFFLLSGPIVVSLYFSRWFLGNMMGELFTKEVTLPGPGSVGDIKVKLKLFPPYALADMQDFVRHFKVLIVGGITLIIYGFIIMLLYYYTHWAEAIIAAVKAGWTAIITSIPAFQP